MYYAQVTSSKLSMFFFLFASIIGCQSSSNEDLSKYMNKIGLKPKEGHVYVFFPVDALCTSCGISLDKSVLRSDSTTVIKIGQPANNEVGEYLTGTTNTIEDSTALARAFLIVTVTPKAFIFQNKVYQELPL